MTKKDFELIACMLSYTEIKDKKSITALLKSTNANFKEERFWSRVEDYQNGRV